MHDDEAVAASLGDRSCTTSRPTRPTTSRWRSSSGSCTRCWDSIDFGASWFADNEQARATTMLHRLVTWLHDSRAELTRVAVEEPFEVTVGDAVVAGRVDRLERDRAGRLVVVDLKTGKSKPRDADLPEHPQLGAYQLAIQEGAFGDRAGSRAARCWSSSAPAAAPSSSGSRRWPRPTTRSGPAGPSITSPPACAVTSSPRSRTRAARSATCAPAARCRSRAGRCRHERRCVVTSTAGPAHRRRRARRPARAARAHRRAGRGHRVRPRAGRRRRRRRLGQDRDDGRPRGVAGRQPAGRPRRGPRTDLHPQGRGRARRPHPPPAGAVAPRRRVRPARRRRAPGALQTGRTHRVHLRRLRRPAGRRAGPAGRRRARRPAAVAGAAVAAGRHRGAPLAGRAARLQGASRRWCTG